MSELPQGTAIVSQGAIGNLRELQGMLEDMGIASRLVAPPEGQRSS